MTIQYDEMVSIKTGEIDRRIFNEQEIFDREIEQIFGRAWLFVCHETQIKKPGDFFEAPMGLDNVLIVRQKDKTIKGLLNTCSHRGNTVCRAEEGNTKNFMCTYHGWTFDLGGKLIGVPERERFFKGDLEPERYPLKEVAQIDSYKGFVFATMDSSAPPLEEYLGNTGRLGIDLIAARGDMEIVPGIQKFVVDANWKLMSDNAFDWYHAPITHVSAVAAGILADRNAEAESEADESSQDGDPEAEALMDQIGEEFGLNWISGESDNITVLAEFGHAISGPTTEAFAYNKFQKQEWRQTPEAQEALGPVGVHIAGHPNIFPTTWITVGAQLSLRVPRGPEKTEIWWFSFQDKNASDEDRKALLFRQNHLFGPAGMLEQEDGENWVQATMQSHGTGSREVPHALKMGLGRGKTIREHGLVRIDGTTNEHAQLWMYHSWQEWMRGSSWEKLRNNTVPGDLI